MVSSPANKKKILMLHGYSMNAKMFSKKMAAVRKACDETLELVFINAPHILHPVDIDGVCEAVKLDPASEPRAWWTFSADRTAHCHGLDKTLTYLMDVLKADQYEGVFGFSQGAALAAFLAALLERPHVHPAWMIDGKPLHPPFKFCVAISGFKAPDPLRDVIFSPSYSTPTLHILGRTDIIVIPEWSEELAEASKFRRVEKHRGGHFVPSKANWRKFFCDYLNDPLGDVPSPGLCNL